MRHLTLAAFAMMAGLAACDRDASVAPSTNDNEVTADDAAARIAGEMVGTDSVAAMAVGMDLAVPEVYMPGASDVGTLAEGATPKAGRMAASGTPVQLGFGDTAQGKLVVTSTKTLAAGMAYDTLVAGWKNGAVDTTTLYSLRGARVWNNGTIERYSLRSVTEGQSVFSGKVRLEGSRSLPGGQGQNVLMIADAGSDGNFDAGADNRVWSIDWVRTNGSDTTARASIRPLDEGKPLSGPGASALFAAQAWEGRVLAHPRHTSFWRIVAHVHGTDTLAVSLSAARHWAGGRIDTLWTENANRSDSTRVWPGDTARVVFSGERPSGDSFAEVRIEVLTHLVKDLGKPGNTTVGLRAYREHRVGPVARSEFEWTAKTEVPEGQDPVDGEVSLEIEMVDGRKASFEGEFGPHGFDGTWTSPDGDTVTVHKTNN